MAEIFSRYLTPLTYAMWVTILIGCVDHFILEFLPPIVSEINIFIMLLFIQKEEFYYIQVN